VHKTIKGRAAKKLDADKVRDIRRRHANSEATPKELASEFGVSVSAIIHVLARKTFKHVD
jgi:AraC-like DNA-binding protein